MNELQKKYTEHYILKGEGWKRTRMKKYVMDKNLSKLFSYKKKLYYHVGRFFLYIQIS